ncbi:MAG: hypothetical protein OIF55_19030 [Amphritea sp.]|nr:hypothetical protein [Amphritea sp.]
MMSMIEGLARHVSEGNPLIAVFVGILLAIALFRQLYSLTLELKERRNNDLKGALELEGLSDDVRFVIQESLNRTYFYRATGLTSDPFTRSKISRFLKSTKGDISLFGIKRVSEYINVKNGKLLIEFRKIDVIDYYSSMMVAVASGLLFLIAVVMVLIIWRETPLEALTVAIVGGMMLATSLHSIWKVSNFSIAKTVIKPALEKFEKSEKGQADPNTDVSNAS